MFFNFRKKEQDKKLSKALDDNLEKFKQLFDTDKNNDIVIREFFIKIDGLKTGAFIVFVDGLVNSDSINDFILRPLMSIGSCGLKSVKKLVSDSILPYCEIDIGKNTDEVVKGINEGNTALIVDGINQAWLIDTKGFKERSVERSLSEVVIRGPHESFTENIRTNTSLIRRKIKSKDLISEKHIVGKKSNTPCVLMYDKTLADEHILAEAKKRIKAIDADFMFDSGQMENYIEDNNYRILPQMIATERPDHVSFCISKGQIALIVDGSPQVLIFPTNVAQISKAVEDNYLRKPYRAFLLLIRSMAYLISLFLTPFFVAILTYHSFLLPLDILFTIEASYEKVPFSTVMEFIGLEFAFELIREASTRMPSTLGSTLGIIGGLIVGEATVDANLVSPIGIIIIAIVAISTFAIPNYFVGYGVRISKFIYLFLGGISGFLGLALGFFLFVVNLSSMKSFGQEYFNGIFPCRNGDGVKISVFYSEEPATQTGGEK